MKTWVLNLSKNETYLEMRWRLTLVVRRRFGQEPEEAR